MREIYFRHELKREAIYENPELLGKAVKEEQ